VEKDPTRLKITVTHARKVNWSLVSAGIPLVWEVAAENLGSTPLSEAAVKWEIPGYLEGEKVALPRLAPRQRHTIGPEKLRWLTQDSEAAARLPTSESSALRVSVGKWSVSCKVDLLTADEWCYGVSWSGPPNKYVLDSTVELSRVEFDAATGSIQKHETIEKVWKGDPPLQAATAALVLTDHPWVVGLKDRSVAGLRPISGELRPAPEEWTAGTAAQQLNLVRAAYVTLGEFYRDAHHDIEKFSLQARSQRIRFPDEVPTAGAGQGHGVTCIDFALAAGAVLEACGLETWFILVGTGGPVCHALTGCWLGPPPAASSGARPLLLNKRADLAPHLVRPEDLSRESFDDPRFLPIDASRLARGSSFKEAVVSALGCFRSDYQFLYALNLTECRRLDPPVRPLSRPGSARPRLRGLPPFSEVCPDVVRLLERGGGKANA
jgi:hypothetical protein